MESGVHEGAAAWPSRIGPRNRVRPTLVYLGAFLAALLLQEWVDLRLTAAPIRAWQWTAGLVLATGGAILFFWSLRLFLKAGTGLMPDQAAARLVTSGPYRLSRNPQFVGFSAVYIGLALVMNVLWPILLLPLVVVITNATVIRLEERYLTRVFGDTYTRYQRQVRRWL
jgi:protein-S-isoprenylcysteine O-methyltransferase Ste14